MAEIQWGLLNGVVPSFGEQMQAFQAGENTVYQKQQVADQMRQRGIQEQRLAMQDQRQATTDQRQAEMDARSLKKDEREQAVQHLTVLDTVAKRFQGLNPDQIGQAFDGMAGDL